MTEHLALGTRGPIGTDAEPILSPELNPPRDARLSLGVKAVRLLGSLDTTLESAGQEVYDSSNEMLERRSMGDTVSNSEGSRNAELFKEAYDTTIEAIENAFEAEGTELSSKLGNILSSIDTLSATPYISSAPEFVDLVSAARSNITEAIFYITRDSGPEMSQAVANALSQAKQKLAGTTVAYSPQS